MHCYEIIPSWKAWICFNPWLGGAALFDSSLEGNFRLWGRHFSARPGATLPHIGALFALTHFFGLHTKSLIILKFVNDTFGIGGGIAPIPLATSLVRPRLSGLHFVSSNKVGLSRYPNNRNRKYKERISFHNTRQQCKQKVTMCSAVELTWTDTQRGTEKNCRPRPVVPKLGVNYPLRAMCYSLGGNAETKPQFCSILWVITAKYCGYWVVRPNRYLDLGNGFKILGTTYLDQPCPTKMAYWAKNYVTVLTRAARWMAYFDLTKLNLA